jgi:DNA topoisomerase-3
MASQRPSPLGTASTRATLIETLIARGHVRRDAGELVPSEIGSALVEAVRDTPLASAALTAEWEARLARIAAGEQNADDFLNDTIASLPDLVRALGARGTSAKPRQPDGNTVGPCPRCGAPVRSLPHAFACVSGNEGCGFTLPRRFAGRTVPTEQVKLLLANGRTDALDGFRTARGTIRAALVLRDGATVSLERVGDERAPRSVSDVHRERTRNRRT